MPTWSGSTPRPPTGPWRPDITAGRLLANPRFAGALRALRERAGMSVRGLATTAHVSPAHISGLENGKRTASLELVDHLDRTLRANGALVQLVHDPERDVDADEREDRMAHALRHPDRLDAKAVAAFAKHLSNLRRMDDEVPAPMMLPMIEGATPVMDGLARQARGEHAAAAHFVVAEWLQFAGWIHAQVQHHGTADALYARSTEHAERIGAGALASESRRFRCSLALYRGLALQSTRHYLAAADTPGAGILHRVDATLRASHGLARLDDRVGALDLLR
ncbi:helix-turn-helix domain-containing protein [Promicromonospora sukumoe]|uniref:helix-turn-helix domain-containing protein n=1 Tax=Promicromonospora sukumoe TaxID=88382 RepID=UPI0037C7F1C7